MKKELKELNELMLKENNNTTKEEEDNKDRILLNGVNNGSFKRINKLTEEVKVFLKQNRIKTTNKGSIIVNKDLFLETLVDYQIPHRKDYNIKYNFLNERINKKFYNIYNNNLHHYDIQDLVSDIQYKIVSHLEDKNTVEINFDGYKKFSDDISYIIYIMDKEINREILEYNYIYYDRDKKSDTKYFKPLGDFIYLDQEIDGKYPNYELIVNNMYEEDFFTSNEFSYIEEEKRVNEIIKKVGLTKRQEEVLKKLMKNNYNQSKTAKEEGIKPKAINKIVKRIRERFELFYNKTDSDNIEKEGKKTGLVLLDDFLCTDFSNEDLLNFIKNHIDIDKDIEDIFYKAGNKESRKEVIRYFKNKEYSKSLSDQYLKDFLKEFYKKNKIDH